jgi:hypothetical protein
MLSELHKLNLKLCSKWYNKINLLHLILAPQLSSDWQRNYSTKTKQAGRAIEQSCVFENIELSRKWILIRNVLLQSIKNQRSDVIIILASCLFNRILTNLSQEKLKN